MRVRKGSPARGQRNRRWLTIATAAAVAGMLLALVAVENARACGDEEPDFGPDSPVVEKSGKRRVVRLNFRRKEYTFAGGHRTLSEIQVFTRDRALIAFLAKKGMGVALWKAIRKTADRTNCSVLYSGKQLARLEQRLKHAVARHFLGKTRRAAGAIDVMLVTEQDRTGNTDCLPPSPGRARKR